MPAVETSVESFVSPEDFREVILAVEKYPEFLKEVKRVQVHERSDTSMRATFWIELAFAGFEVKTEYTLRYTIGETEIAWELDGSPTVTKNRGRWRLEPGKDGDGTLARYEAEVETNAPIPPDVQAMFAKETLPKLVASFRDRAED
ncbi:MAG: SRPBCC family protein [Deltaproteobacteria bacterium]|nr:SRPBCC family protein [Deltaproteobacteria bacterium]